MKVEHPHPTLLPSRFGNPLADAIGRDLPFWMDARDASSAVTITVASGVPDAAAVFFPNEKRVAMLGKSPWPAVVKAIGDLATANGATALLGEQMLVGGVADALQWKDRRMSRSQVLTTRSMAPAISANAVALRPPKEIELALLASWCAADAAETTGLEGWKDALDFLRAGRRIVVAVDEGDEPTAMASWNAYQRTDMDREIAIDVVDLTNVQVRPDRRLRGLGRSLIESLLAKLAASPPSYGRRDSAVVARIDTSNGDAQKFWAKMGFAPHGVWETWEVA